MTHTLKQTYERTTYQNHLRSENTCTLDFKPPLPPTDAFSQWSIILYEPAAAQTPASLPAPTSPEPAPTATPSTGPSSAAPSVSWPPDGSELQRGCSASSFLLPVWIGHHPGSLHTHTLRVSTQLTAHIFHTHISPVILPALTVSSSP